MEHSPEEATGSASSPGDAREIYSLRRRVVYWGVAYAIALSVTAAVVFPDPAIVGTVPFFPQGLFFFLNPLLALLLGWATHVGMSVAVLRSGRADRFHLLFALFCVMLALNVMGCPRVADGVGPGH